jgi:hypothetical protein
MYDKEALDARRDMIARTIRTSCPPDTAARYLSAAIYGRDPRPSRPVTPAPPAPAVPRATTADAEQIIESVVDDTGARSKDTNAGAPSGRRWWRRRGALGSS